MIYHSKLLRYWQEPETGSSTEPQAVWRFSLEDVHTGERHGFANLAVLVEFLQAQTSAPRDDLAPRFGSKAASDE